MTSRLLFSNIGYARGIDGRIGSHIRGARHHFICPPSVQMRTLTRLKAMLHQHQVDLAMIAEIDTGSSNNGQFDQMHFLRDTAYPHAVAINKYGRPEGARRSVASGKSNGFLAKVETAYTARYLSHGTKRLICQIRLADDLSVWFGHFSLRPWIRQRQFAELAEWLQQAEGEVLILGDFNNYRGMSELHRLTGEAGLSLLSPPHPTFRFGRYRASIDLCLASRGLVERCHVTILSQDFSDHDALLVEIR